MRNSELKQGCGLQRAQKTEQQVPASFEKELARARNAAYRFLTYRSRSKMEVENKLLDKGLSLEIVRTILADLIRLGYVNDCEFARQWASARIKRGFGRRRIERELRAKGIGREMVAESLQSILRDDIEMRTAGDAARKKLKTLQSVDRETCRRRLAGFLERKGYSYDVIRTVLTDMDRITLPAL